MYSWSNCLKRRKCGRKQESYLSLYLQIFLVRDNRKKHTFMNKVRMNRLLLIQIIYKKQLNQDWIPLGSDWKEKNHQ